MDAFDSFAPYYERFSRAYRHDRWLSELARLAHLHGLPGLEVFDVACGTGKSTTELDALGYRVVGCDISTQMLEVARDLLPEVEFHLADMRQLPALGEFSWITCINDAINYLLGDDDLFLAFASMGERLVPGGLLTFDVTSPTAHHRIYSGSRLVADDEAYICWHGHGIHSDAPSAIGRANVVIFKPDGERWERVDSHHVQRLWSSDDIADAADRAGLELVAAYGQRPGCFIEPEINDDHPKIVYFLRRPNARASGTPEAHRPLPIELERR